MMAKELGSRRARQVSGTQGWEVEEPEAPEAALRTWPPPLTAPAPRLWEGLRTTITNNSELGYGPSPPSYRGR